MDKIKRKLKSEKGVSILFGLLAFLVAAMISITVIAACMSSLWRVYDDRDDNQVRLTLLSAAQFIRQEMGETRYLFISAEEKIQTTTIYDDGTVNTETKYQDYPDEDQVKTEGPLAKEILTAVEELENNNFISDYKSTSTMTVELEGEDMDPVNVSFVMKAAEKERYTLYFTFSLTDSNYQMYMTINLQNPPKSGQKMSERSDGGSPVANQSALKAQLRAEYGFPKQVAEPTEIAVEGGRARTTYEVDIQEENTGIKEFVWSVANAEISEVNEVKNVAG